MFGDGPTIKVCCGPRCGVHPQHRAIFAAAESARCDAQVIPTMCRGLCGEGVTLVREDGAKVKAQSAAQACAQLS